MYSDEIAIDLIDKTMSAGLSVVQLYLEKVWKHPWYLVDMDGHALFCDRKSRLDSFRADELLSKIEEPFYQPKTRRFFFPVRNEDYQVRLCLVGERVAPGKWEEGQREFARVEAAIVSFYGKPKKVIEKTKLYFERPLTFTDFSRQIGPSLLADGLYCVCAARAEEELPDVLWKHYYELLYGISEINRHRLLPFAFPGWMFGIVYAGRDAGNPSMEYLVHMGDAKPFFDKHLHVTCSVSTGSCRPKEELWRSYREAVYAIALGHAFGKRNFYHCSTKLGIFSMLIGQEREKIQELCRQVQKPLQEYDRKHDSQLLETLTLLVNKNYNRKETSDLLDINITTLYYRLDQIEHLLGYSVTEAMGRAQAVCAVKGVALLADTEEFEGTM